MEFQIFTRGIVKSTGSRIGQGPPINRRLHADVKIGGNRSTRFDGGTIFTMDFACLGWRNNNNNREYFFDYAASTLTLSSNEAQQGINRGHGCVYSDDTLHRLLIKKYIYEFILSRLSSWKPIDHDCWSIAEEIASLTHSPGWLLFRGDDDIMWYVCVQISFCIHRRYTS